MYSTAFKLIDDAGVEGITADRIRMALGIDTKLMVRVLEDLKKEKLTWNIKTRLGRIVAFIHFSHRISKADIQQHNASIADADEKVQTVEQIKVGGAVLGGGY